ncbi:dihydroorotase [Arsenicitalea aurantiaca]|uniref:Dihydroorotase n=1 Tax=Arsenicitalea aurantiaca TaxID=1783274 RepID=A0A433X418_9HYPH|nr:dihydroorotase [Arsenicitalea aurantiaca]RUT28813.1 dihydroorotase [Arsenicitalea aurantiaca]
MRRLTFRRPDDWHVHFRDGAMLETVVPHTARAFGRAIVMPNLVPPVTDRASASAYRDRIVAAVPQDADFTPLMTCYLTDHTDPADLIAGFREGLFAAAKLYPAHATTNSAHGVSSIRAIDGVLGAMADAGMPLLTHGEITRPEVDIFDREKGFVDEVLIPTLERFPTLRVVMEHITTRQGAELVAEHPDRMGATITPQHLLYNRNALFAGGLRPHMFCLPILKRAEHQEALRKAATSGRSNYFLGTDTAPHLRHLKEADCGCAGVFSAPVAIGAYLKVFAEEDALDRFEAFASLNGPAFYGRAPNEARVTYEERATPVPATIATGEGELVPLFGGGSVDWIEASQ